VKPGLNHLKYTACAIAVIPSMMMMPAGKAQAQQVPIPQVMTTLREAAFAADEELIAPMMWWRYNGVSAPGAVKADPYDNKRAESPIRSRMTLGRPISYLSGNSRHNSARNCQVGPPVGRTTL
jgi:hypothetical protein